MRGDPATRPRPLCRRAPLIACPSSARGYAHLRSRVRVAPQTQSYESWGDVCDVPLAIARATSAAVALAALCLAQTSVVADVSYVCVCSSFCSVRRCPSRRLVTASFERRWRRAKTHTRAAVTGAVRSSCCPPDAKPDAATLALYLDCGSDACWRIDDGRLPCPDLSTPRGRAWKHASSAHTPPRTGPEHIASVILTRAAGWRCVPRDDQSRREVDAPRCGRATPCDGVTRTPWSS